VSTYPAGLFAPMKYPVPQYKPGVVIVISPHSTSVISYEGYTIAP
jgi:hypothetical protein